MSNKKLVIMRGVPGSGKSTTVEEILDSHDGLDHYFIDVWSADDYFVRPDGVYDFSFKTLKNAHAWCREGVKASMSVGTHLVIVDNTNTRKWEYQVYLDMAEKYGYEVEEVIVGEFSEEALKLYAERNVHGVPLESIKKMMERFER